MDVKKILERLEAMKRTAAGCGGEHRKCATCGTRSYVSSSGERFVSELDRLTLDIEIDCLRKGVELVQV